MMGTYPYSSGTWIMAMMSVGVVVGGVDVSLHVRLFAT